MLYRLEEANTSRNKFFDRDDKELPIFISDNEDIYINFNKFKNGIINKCLIAGLSGSGKSTLAAKLAKKYNAEHVNLDRIRGNKYFTDEEMKKENPSIYYWFTHECDYPRQEFEYLKNKKEEWERCFYWLLSSKKPMIIEGHFTDVLKSDERLQKDYPIIFKRTSMTKSIIRMLKRELFKEKYTFEKDHNIINAIPWLVKHISKYYSYKKTIDNAMHLVMKHNPTDYQYMHESNKINLLEDMDTTFLDTEYEIE